MGRQFPDAVDRAIIQPLRAMRLRLQPDPDVLDRTRDDGVGDAGEGAGEVVLAVRQRRGGQRGLGGVAGFEGPAGVVEGAELDGDTGADAEERG